MIRTRDYNNSHTLQQILRGARVYNCRPITQKREGEGKGCGLVGFWWHVKQPARELSGLESWRRLDFCLCTSLFIISHTHTHTQRYGSYVLIALGEMKIWLTSLEDKLRGPQTIMYTYHDEIIPPFSSLFYLFL